MQKLFLFQIKVIGLYLSGHLKLKAVVAKHLSYLLIVSHAHQAFLYSMMTFKILAICICIKKIKIIVGTNN